MSNRPTLAPAALERQKNFHAETVAEVEKAVATHPVVVVGMAQNPFVKKVRQALAEANIDFHYLEYGSYLSEWKKRLAIKLWSGWPTFPQVFVRGVLIGGDDLTRNAIADGSLSARLAERGHDRVSSDASEELGLASRDAKV